MKKSFFSRINFARPRSRRFKKRNLRALIACLFISLAAWGFIKISKTFEADFEVPVAFVNSRVGEIVSNQSHQLVTYTLTASGLKILLNKISSQVDTLFADLRNTPRIERDGNTWSYIAENQMKQLLFEAFGPGFRVLQVTPDTVFAALGRVVEKMVPVRIDSSLSFEKGFGVRDSLLLSTDSVKISGPARVVDTINVVYTNRIQLENLSKSKAFSVQIVNPGTSSGLQLFPHQVEVTIPIEEFTEASLDIPLRVKQTPGKEGGSLQLKLFPERVNVVFMVPLRDYASVGHSHFDAYVLAPSPNDGVKYLEVFVESIHGFVRIQSISPALVECIILE